MQKLGFLTVFLLCFCLLTTDVPAQQQLLDFHLVPHREVTHNYFLFDQNNNEFAGEIAVTMSQIHQDGETRLRMHLGLPERLEKGYDRIFLNITALAPTAGFLRQISRQNRIRLSQHRIAPREVHRFFSTPDNDRRFLILKEPSDQFFAEINENKDFEAIFSFSDPSPAIPFDFNIELTLYYIERQWFKGVFYPFTLRVHLEPEYKVEPMLYESLSQIKEEDTAKEPFRDTGAVTIPSYHHDLRVSDNQEIRKTQQTRPTNELKTPLHHLAHQGTQQMQARTDTQVQDADLDVLNNLLEESADVYNVLFSLYSSSHEPDLAIVHQHKNWLARIIREFEHVVREPSIDRSVINNKSNEFWYYNNASSSMIAELLGEEVVPEKQRRSDANSHEISRTRLFIIIGSLLILAVGGLFLLARWQKKAQKTRIQRKIKSQATRELHRQKFEMHKQKKSLKI